MGLFSWKTQDTNESIPCACSSRPTFRVIMTDNKGNQSIEDNYEGYGEFGGVDYYELLSEMNEGPPCRDTGIDMAFSKDPTIIFPSLSKSGAYFSGVSPEPCEYQGAFYD